MLSGLPGVCWDFPSGDADQNEVAVVLFLGGTHIIR